YTHSENLADLLSQLRITLLISTYQAGKVVVVGVHDDQLAFSFHTFQQPMGIAVSPGRLAVGTKQQVVFLPRAEMLGPQIAPAGRFDACYLSRLAHITGPIHIHELAWGADELWFVNTLFSCLCTIDRDSSFVPRWKPPFISSLADEDRCHLNSVALQRGQPRYVTALAESDTAAGWREHKATGGCIIDVPSGEICARGLSMPHSIRTHEDRVWFLNSGFGQLSTLDPKTGGVEGVFNFQGYTRGLAMYGPFAFVGQSRVRETNIFGGLEIGKRHDELECGISIVDLRSGRRAGHLVFETGVEEIFDVQILQGVKFPAIIGPNSESDDEQRPIWLSATPQWLT
ncbi:MAG: TIGR03032 family protein, partial [Pirellulales bacterium]